MLTGRTITGTDAVRRGIATEAVPAAEVLPAAIALAKEVAASASPAALERRDPSWSLRVSDLGDESR